MAKTPIEWWRAEEVEAIAQALIPDYHEHLAGEPILYLFRSKHAEKNGHVVLGKARRVSGLNAFLATRHPDIDDQPRAAPVLFIVEIAFDMWMRLRTSQRIALVDHELQHITPDGLRGHDVEEFLTIMRRHGAWETGLTEFLEASREPHVFEPRD